MQIKEKYKCPHCGCTKFNGFIPDALVWKLNGETGEYNCEIYAPDETDVFECVNCNHTDKGYYFLVKE
jgi:hypothetical protein